MRLTQSGKRKTICIQVNGETRYSYPSDDVQAWALRLAVCLNVDNLEEVFWMLRSLRPWGDKAGDR